MSRVRKLTHNIALSVSSGMGTEIPISGVDRWTEGGRGERDPSHLRFCRLRIGEVERSTLPRPPENDGATQAGGIAIDGSAEGPDIDALVSPVPEFEEEAILGQTFLVPRVRRRHGRPECGHDTKVCPLSGKEGTATRAASIYRLKVITPAQLLGSPPLGEFLKATPYEGRSFTMNFSFVDNQVIKF